MPFNADPYISKTPGFPKEGITFYDISPILEDSAVIRQAMDALADLTRPMQPDIIAGVDARGFLFALPLALELACGMVMVRKAGKLPGELFEQSYALEYGEARLSIQASRQLRGKRVVLCDDLLATGGTMAAAIQLLRQVGGDVVGAASIIELTFLQGRERLNVPFSTILSYDS